MDAAERQTPPHLSEDPRFEELHDYELGFHDSTLAFRKDPRPESATDLFHRLAEVYNRPIEVDERSRYALACEKTVMLLLKAPGTAIEERHYRELALDAIETVHERDLKMRLLLELAEHSHGAAKQHELLTQAKEMLSGEAWQSQWQLFSPESCSRREAYL